MDSFLRFTTRNVIASSRLMPTGFRAPILRRAGVDIGEKSHLRDSLRFVGDVRVGDHCFLNAGSVFDAGDDAEITLGNHVVVGMRCLVIAADHVLGGPDRRAVGGAGASIAIGGGCWIGAGVIVLPGVTIAPGCVIGAGSTVTRATDPNGIYAGSPARRIRELDPTVRLDPPVVERLPL